MTIDIDRFIKGKRFTQEFILDDDADQVIPKTNPGSAIGDAIVASTTPVATDLIQGKVSLAVEANFPSVSDEEATTPAFVALAIETAVTAIPDAADDERGLVELNLGSALPEDVDNSTDALTSHGAIAIMQDTTVAGGNVLQKAVLDAVEATIADDTSAQDTIAEAIVDDIHAKFPVAGDGVQGKVGLATEAHYPEHTNDVDATTPAYVKSATDQAVADIPDASDTLRGLVELNLGTDLPGDTSNTTDALTSGGLNTMLTSTAVPSGNAVQAAAVVGVAQALGADSASQDTIAEALVDDIHSKFPVAADTVQGKVSLAVEANFPSTSNVEATTPAYVGAAIAAIPDAADDARGLVQLNRGTDMPGDVTNANDALTAAGANAINNDAVTPGGNPAQLAVVHAVGRALGSDATAQDRIATAIVDDIHSKFPVAADTVQGKVSLAVNANFPSNVDNEATTPAYVNNAIATLVPPATDTIQGRVALNVGSNLPNDAFNSTDALTAAGFNLVANSTVNTPNSLQQAVVNAVEKGIANDSGAQLAIANAVVDEVHAAFPVAEDTVQGKVALNTGSALPNDAFNSTDALTAVGLSNILDTTATPGGNAVQLSVVSAIGQALVSDAGTQAVMADLLKDDISTAIANHAPSMQTLVNSFPVATDTVQGKVGLAVEANFPSTSDVEATTPAYVKAFVDDAIDGIITNATDTVAGVVQLNLGTNMPSDATNNVDALTASGMNSILQGTTAGGNAAQKAVVKAFNQALSSDTVSQTNIANTLADDIITNFAGSTSFAALVKDKETTTTFVLTAGKYVHTNEDGVSAQIDPAELASTDAGNAIGIGTDGKLKTMIPAQLPEDQVLTGDNSGTVGLVLTPVEDPVTSDVNYTIKADLKVATTTPSAVANSLKWSASGFYVDTATDTIKGAVALNTGSDLVNDPTNSVDALTAVGLSNVLNDTVPANGNAVQQAVVNAIKKSLPSNSSAQTVIAEAIVDDVIALLPDAGDTVKGIVSLAVNANYPSTSNVEATTPLYVKTAIDTAVDAIPVIADATDTVKGKVSLAVAANFPSTSDVEAATPAYVTAYVDDALANAAPNITAKEEGTDLTTSMTSINFVGDNVTATASGGAVTVTVQNGAVVSDTPPAAPYKDMLWYDSDVTGRLFVYDGTQWVDASPPSVMTLFDAFE